MTRDLCLLAAFTLAVASHAVGQSAPLKGLSDVRVSVEASPSDSLKAFGFDVDQVQNDAELRLRELGIRVNAASRVHLWMGLDAHPGTNQFSGALMCQLREPVTLARIPGSYFEATTWTEGFTFVVGTKNVPELAARVMDCVNRFANAYLEANPRTSPR